jgi:precorrin-2 dehydrogenase/sirohydrochlorin ferrochelatase
MLPLTLDVDSLPIVLVGRGEAVRRRLAALDDAAARALRVFSDEPPDGLAATAGDRLRRHLPTANDLIGARLVLIAGLPRELSERLAIAARAHGALVNVEDIDALCDVHMPAVVRRGGLSVAISTGGRSPGLARLLKGVFEQLLDPRWGVWLDELAAHRVRWRGAGLAMAEVGRRTAALVLARGWLRLAPVRAAPTPHPNLPPQGGKESDVASGAMILPPPLRGRGGEGGIRIGAQPPGIVPFGSEAQ